MVESQPAGSRLVHEPRNEASCSDAGVGWRIEFHQPGDFTGRDQSAAAEVHSP
jgi:hypothetical protein